MDKQTALKTNTPRADAGATDILRADHAQARKDLAEYRRLMDEHAETRSALAQDICMQIELHDLVEREIFYPAIEPQAHDAVDSALRAHDDIQQCVQLLRRLPEADAEHDSTMMRLMDLLEYHFKEEEEVLFPLVESRMGGRLRALGADIIKRREKVAGAVRDLEAPAT